MTKQNRCLKSLQHGISAAAGLKETKPTICCHSTPITDIDSTTFHLHNNHCMHQHKYMSQT